MSSTSFTSQFLNTLTHICGNFFSHLAIPRSTFRYFHGDSLNYPMIVIAHFCILDQGSMSLVLSWDAKVSRASLYNSKRNTNFENFKIRFWRKLCTGNFVSLCSANLSGLINFCFRWNHQKTYGFLTFSRGIQIN